MYQWMTDNTVPTYQARSFRLWTSSGKREKLQQGSFLSLPVKRPSLQASKRNFCSPSPSLYPVSLPPPPRLMITMQRPSKEQVHTSLSFKRGWIQTEALHHTDHQQPSVHPNSKNLNSWENTSKRGKCRFP